MPLNQALARQVWSELRSLSVQDVREPHPRDSPRTSSVDVDVEIVTMVKSHVEGVDVETLPHASLTLRR